MTRWVPGIDWDKHRVILMPQIPPDSLRHHYNRVDILPLTIPPDLYSRISSFHSAPVLWWVGQVVRYVFRPKKEIQKFIDKSAESLGFTGSVIGLQIRRTDKHIEAPPQPLKKYMAEVKYYFGRVESKQNGENINRKVFLATDAPDLLSEVREMYPDYTFLSNNTMSRLASLPRTRYTEESLHGILTDLWLLARCEFLVCTLSSNVCRVAYQLMQTLRGDATRNVVSVDDTSRDDISQLFTAKTG